MQGSFLFQCLQVVILGLVFVCRAGADVPPPPQLLGVYDTGIENPTEADCRVSHGINMADRHHVAGQNQNNSGDTILHC